MALKLDHVQAAAKEHTSLNVFAAVVAILEGGCVYGHNAAALRIIQICQDEQQKCLRAYDRHRAQALPRARKA